MTELRRATLSAPLRRLGWRLGRRLYCAARGEPSRDDIATDGEAYVQRCVIGRSPKGAPLCAVDIGANKGDWTLSFLDGLARSGPRPAAAVVHAFEPVPATRALLEQRIAAAGAGGAVVVHGLAVSDRSGQASMGIVGTTGGRNAISAGAGDDRATEGSIAVETVTLAEHCLKQGIDRIQLAKSDAEGHDLNVLRGARELLAARRIDLFQFEYNHNWVLSRAFLRDVFDLVEGLPYRVARIRPNSVEALPAWHPELERFFHANYLLVHEPALAWLDVTYGEFDVSNTYA